MKISSDKTIRGIGSKAVIRGKGLVINGAKNIIIQNIWITELNPQYIWGGDALSLQDTDNIWIDHCKFSLIGRQMIVTGFGAAGRVTISNCDFDGRTPYSATCNGMHYWTLLFLGANDKITLYSNHIHSVSGRSPKVAGPDTNGAKVVVHIANNLYQDVGGEALELGTGADVSVDANVFDNVKKPMYSYGGESFAAV